MRKVISLSNSSTSSSMPLIEKFFIQKLYIKLLRIFLVITKNRFRATLFSQIVKIFEKWVKLREYHCVFESYINHCVWIFEKKRNSFHPITQLTTGYKTGGTFSTRVSYVSHIRILWRNLILSPRRISYAIYSTYESTPRNNVECNIFVTSVVRIAESMPWIR